MPDPWKRRKFIGVEIDEGYFDTACRRIEDAYRQPDMLIEAEKQTQPEQLDMLGAETDGEAP